MATPRYFAPIMISAIVLAVAFSSTASAKSDDTSLEVPPAYIPPPSNPAAPTSARLIENAVILASKITKGLNASLSSSDGNEGAGSSGGKHGSGIAENPLFIIPSVTENTYAAFGIASIIGIIIMALVAGRTCYVDSARMLMDESRRKIFGMIQEKPGIYLTQICVELNSNTTRALWHLRKLQSAGLIRTDKLNGKRTYYPLIYENRNC